MQRATTVWAAWVLVLAATVAPAAFAAEVPASHPVVLVPGFFGGREAGVVTSYFAGLKLRLEAEGAHVTEAAPPPIASSQERGRALLRAIDDVLEETGASRVIVIAHSQGGLDVRVALAEGGADRIAAVATLSSPHAGSGVADTALLWPRPLVNASLFVAGATLQALMGDAVTKPDPSGSLVSLSSHGTASFSEDDGTVEGVPFFSIATVSGRDVDSSCAGGAWSAPHLQDELHPALQFGAAMIRGSWGEVSHDGVVPTQSMRFARYLGCIPADHLDVQGVTDASRAFDQNAFYVELYRGLRDVSVKGDASAMNAHVFRLATLAYASPHRSAMGLRAL